MVSLFSKMRRGKKSDLFKPSGTNQHSQLALCKYDDIHIMLIIVWQPFGTFESGASHSEKELATLERFGSVSHSVISQH